MTTTETDVAWQHLADACLEHDGEHCARACAELRRLVPEQREATTCRPSESAQSQVARS